jgi:hypothetical protein
MTNVIIDWRCGRRYARQTSLVVTVVDSGIPPAKLCLENSSPPHHPSFHNYGTRKLWNRLKIILGADGFSEAVMATECHRYPCWITLRTFRKSSSSSTPSSSMLTSISIALDLSRYPSSFVDDCDTDTSISVQSEGVLTVMLRQ